jgi:hypothetical protein
LEFSPSLPDHVTWIQFFAEFLWSDFVFTTFFLVSQFPFFNFKYFWLLLYNILHPQEKKQEWTAEFDTTNFSIIFAVYAPRSRNLCHPHRGQS